MCARLRPATWVLYFQGNNHKHIQTAMAQVYLRPWTPSKP
jgi:hypothetical protein